MKSLVMNSQQWNNASNHRDRTNQESKGPKDAEGCGGIQMQGCLIDRDLREVIPQLRTNDSLIVFWTRWGGTKISWCVGVLLSYYFLLEVVYMWHNQKKNSISNRLNFGGVSFAIFLLRKKGRERTVGSCFPLGAISRSGSYIPV